MNWEGSIELAGKVLGSFTSWMFRLVTPSSKGTVIPSAFTPSRSRTNQKNRGSASTVRYLNRGIITRYGDAYGGEKEGKVRHCMFHRYRSQAELCSKSWPPLSCSHAASNCAAQSKEAGLPQCGEHVQIQWLGGKSMASCTIPRPPSSIHHLSRLPTSPTCLRLARFDVENTGRLQTHSRRAEYRKDLIIP